MDHLPPHHPTANTARDIMTTPVLQVAPEITVRDAARLLLENRIGAVPVVDAEGTLVGMVSEGDLLGRSNADRLTGQEWWLAMLSGPGHTEAAATEAAAGRTVRDVMHTPIVTIDEDASVQDTATLLRTQGIKRLPVMRNGEMVGIVARADLIRVVEAIPGLKSAGQPPRGLGDMLAGFFGSTGSAETRTASPALPQAAPAGALTADGFRNLVEQSDQGKMDERKAATHAADLARLDQVKMMLHDHVGEEMWTTLMTHAQVIAAHGGKEIQMLRFPVGLCSDGGRKINNADPAWTETLRGEAAELYARYERELKPAGFGMAARVADYPNGMPGDVALFLVWLN